MSGRRRSASTSRSTKTSSSSCRATVGRTALIASSPAAPGERGRIPRTTLNPDFTIDGTAVILNPLQMATIPTRVLGPAVGRLDGEHIRVIAALDAMIAQWW
ncbi:CcdB family protein [Azospirillum sp.]|uniref:CcdB family protein n=1 Tax=Azospirillum sp. TaxID=34012 RepID=UPI003419D320